jgi:Flp pilus assembly protein TadB
MTALLAAACGAVVGLGLMLILIGWRGTATDPGVDVRDPVPWTARAAARLRGLAAGGSWGEHAVRQAALAVTAAVVVGVVTGWPVGALVAGLAAWALPGVWRPDAAARADADRIEAIAVWTEMLRDTLSAAAGLEQAVLATAAVAPPALAEPVAELAERIRGGQPLATALQGFADDVDDPTADLVVCALVLAATRQARDLTGLLSSLASAARDQVLLRLRVAAGRARIRTSVRIILGTTLVMIVGLVVLNRRYLTPYDGPDGQLVLLLVAGLFAAGFRWLVRIATITPPPRTLRKSDGFMKTEASSGVNSGMEAR